MATRDQQANPGSGDPGSQLCQVLSTKASVATIKPAALLKIFDLFSKNILNELAGKTVLSE